ncbi:MAG: hypothetical protein E7410_03310 [Ruminococcaceae bacterium]|nr:hypothetical protein [Oscillospiraceae bacterium]
MLLNIDEMTLEQKLGMVLCARRFDIKDGDIDYIIELIKKRALGCVQLPANKPEVMEKILAAIKEADYPVLIFNDTETGFPTTKLPHIPLVSLAATGKREYYEAFAKGIVNDAKAAGFNGTWGPVIDILKGDGPCSVHRKFSDTPEKVSEAAEIIAGIYKQNHYISTGKHYPGIGIKEHLFDTHMTEGFATSTKEDLLNCDLLPYKHLLEKGLLPAIMAGHNMFVNIDPDYPASLSKPVLDIIREMGFDGIIFTDSFAMMAILQKYGEENIYGMAIAAGIDIVLPNYRTSVKDCYDMLYKNFKDGAFTEERLDESVRRILKAMEFVAQKPENPTTFTKEDAQLLNDVAKDCITAITDDGLSAKLDGENEDKLFVILKPTTFLNDDGAEISMATWYFPDRIAKKIEKEFPGVGIEYLPEFSRNLDNERVLLAAAKRKEVIFVTFCATQPYLGTDGLTRRTESVINALANSKKVSAVVHFGNPYALKHLLPVKRRIYGYHISKSQEYAIDVLKGNIEAKGTMPYNID